MTTTRVTNTPELPAMIAGDMYEVAVLRNGDPFCSLAAWPESLPALLLAEHQRCIQLEAELAELRAQLAAPSPEPRAPSLFWSRWGPAATAA